MIGESFGSYRILEPLGAGGMGEVYLAEDTKLGRRVAIKALPPAVASDPERLARFEREAKLLAALNHPNIATIYGLEESGGQSCIVMELVQGETLAERIQGGALEPAEALGIARQIADALEAAHEAGIIHRDLKPANVKVTPEGTVKVLDFGLAKAYMADGPGAEMSPDISASPTILAATGAGIILGTAAYMAPEQAKGRVLDRRADVWAFGVVLYEMLTGNRAFGGADITEVIAAVIRDVPDLEALPPESPPALRRLLRRCLEKDPARRLRDIGDARLEIDEALEPAEESGTEEHVTSPPRRPAWVAATVMAVLVAATAMATWALKPVPPVDRPVTRFVISIDDAEGRANLSRPSIALSPDGRQLAYRVGGSVYSRRLDELDSRLVVPEAGALFDISPDGEWALFASGSSLAKKRLAGGPTQELTTDRGIGGRSGASWSADDTVVYLTAEGVTGVPGSGGASRRIVADDATALFWPLMLPDGKAMIYTRFDGGTASTVLVPLDGSAGETILPGAGAVAYVNTGHLLVLSEDSLYAVPFDAARHAVTGTAVALPEKVGVSINTGAVQLAIADNGTLAYFMPSESAANELQLTWVDDQGRAESAFADNHNYADLRLSPDGRRAVAHLLEQDNDVWALDLARGSSTRLTFSPGEDETPLWSPDGHEVAYASSREGGRKLFRKRADGGASAVETLIWEGRDHLHLNDWSPDGTTFIAELRRAGSNDIVAIDAQTGDETPLLQSSFNEMLGRLSPDGRWLAYVSDESGRPEIYVQRYPELDLRVNVSTAGGTEPVWSSDGTALFFRSDQGVMATTRVADAELEFGVPEPLFADVYMRTQGATHIHFDVAADGRFLMIGDPAAATRAAAPQDRIQVVLNWTEELKRLAPPAR